MLGTQASYGFCDQFVSKALDDSSSLESSFTLEQDMEEQDSRETKTPMSTLSFRLWREWDRE